MRAIVLSQPGAKPLRDAVKLDADHHPFPQPGPGQALVRVVSSAANPVDVYIASGDFGGDGAKGKVMAGDLAGVVEEVVPPLPLSSHDPPAPLPFKKGDRVWALTPYFAPSTAAEAGDAKTGCWAEFVVADLAWLAPAPEEAALPLADAGAGPLVLLTAWQALEAALGPPLDESGVVAAPAKTRRVLITAAAGGVGHVAAQLAKVAWGCSVTGVAGDRNRDFVIKTLGADAFVDYADEAQLKAALGEEGGEGDKGFDAAVDLLGGPWTARLAQTVKKTGGKLSHVMNRGTGEAGLDDLRKEHGEGSITTIFVKPDGEALARMARLVEQGKLKVEVAERFPLERAGEALEAVAGWHTRGKVVVTV